jgi:hypothetical protein
MEILTILLSSLLALISPAGFFVDRVAQNNIRSRFDKVEQLQVRVDNPPSYQLLQGKVEHVRIAGRGLWPTKDVRIDVLEVETDPIAVDLRRLQQANKTPRASLKRPAQAGVHLVLTEKDMNQALQSPAVLAQLRQLVSSMLGSAAGDQARRYNIRNPSIKFLGDNRLRLQAELVEADAQPLAVMLESKLEVVAGRQIQLIEPKAVINGKPVSPLVVIALTSNLKNRLDLRNLEASGIIARILQLKTDNNQLEVATFVRVETQKLANSK